MNVTSATKICMVIGDPVAHSVGPQLYNPAFKKMELDYVYLAAHVTSANLGDFVQGIRAMGVSGVSCTIPHKTAVIKFLDRIDPVAKTIGAVNTIVNDRGILTGYNTDWLGILNPLRKVTTLKNKQIALLGTGGAARAIAYGITQAEANLTIYGRDLQQAKTLARQFGGRAIPFNSIADISQSDIIINATSVGMVPEIDKTPVSKQYLRANQLVFDIIYAPYHTRLLREAREQGAEVIHGTEMLLHQGLVQFKLYTGQEAPEAFMRELLLKTVQPGEEL